MRNALRCCISCILPCGALDVIRIVHANGRVEEISGSVKAEEIMKAYPKHVLKKPSTSSSEEGICRPKIVIVPPDAQLQRGKIYFLMPLPASPPQKPRSRSSRSSSNKKKVKKEAETIHANNNSNNIADMADLLSSTSDRYLTEILSEKLSTQRDRRRSRAAVWRPHLESISETPSDAS